jgi:hypothetical protein
MDWRFASNSGTTAFTLIGFVAKQLFTHSWQHCLEARHFAQKVWWQLLHKYGDSTGTAIQAQYPVCNSLL